MKDNFDDKLAKKIRESLENYPVEFDPQAWANLQAQLQPAPVKTVPFWKTLPFRVAASTTVVVALAAVCYFGFFQETENRVTEKKSGIQTIDSAVSKPEPVKTLADKSVEKANISEEASPSEKTKQSDVLLKNSSKTSILEEKKAKFGKNLEKTENVQSQNSHLESEKKEEILLKEDLAMQALQGLSPNLLFGLENIAPLDKNKKFEKQALPQNLALDAQGSPNKKLELRLLVGASANVGMAFGKDVNKTGLSYGGGVHTDLCLGEKWAISTGFQINTVSYITPHTTLYANYSPPTISALPNPLDRQIEEKIYYEAYWQMFQIPLTVKYFATKNFFVNAGMVSYFLGSHSQYDKFKYTHIFGEEKITTGVPSQRNLNPFAIAHLGAGFKTEFNRATLQIEPYLSVPLQEIGKEGISDIMWAGLSFKAYFGSNTNRVL